MKRTIQKYIEQFGPLQNAQIDHDKTVEDALYQLAENDCGLLLVTHRSELVGVYSERDFVRQSLIMDDLNTREIKVVMNRNVVYVTPQYTLQECLAIIVNLKIRHLPVIQEDQELKILGLLSIQDISKMMVQDHEFTIEELTKYISGSMLPADESNKTKRQVRVRHLVNFPNAV